MSTAHIFYIPIMLLTGLLAGFFIGRTYAETERKKKALHAQRMKALKEKSNESTRESRAIVQEAE